MAAQAEPPLHSKCIGFALPGEYYATYLMDRSSLDRGEYAYGRDLVLGWPLTYTGATASPKTTHNLQGLEQEENGL